MLNSLTHTQRDTAQKGASSASKSILPAVNIQVMAPTYHGKACGSHSNRALFTETEFHTEKYDGLENIEKRSRALEVKL